MMANLLEVAAGEFVASHGDAAAPMLRERAEIAGELGHIVAARTWRDLALAAERLAAGGARCRESVRDAARRSS